MEDKEIRHIEFEESERVETGAVKFGDDWAGLFVRGDDCIILGMILEDYYENSNTPSTEAILAMNLYLEIKNALPAK